MKKNRKEAAQPLPARSRGRPRSVATGEQPGGVGRDGLIDATIELLRTLPPAAITPVVVARAVGVHPSLIRYYFSNRATLLVAVAERLTRQFAAQVGEAGAAADATPHSRLCARIGALIDLNATYPFFHQLFVSEIAESDDPAAREMVAGFTHRGQAAYAAILDAGVEDGSFRAIDPGLLYVAVIGMSEFFVSARRQLEVAGGTLVDEQALRDKYKAFVCDLVLNGVNNREGKADHPKRRKTPRPA